MLSSICATCPSRMMLCTWRATEVETSSSYTTHRGLFSGTLSLWGFFSANAILLQMSLWKCHPTTLVMSSLALLSIIHYFPLEASHIHGEAFLFFILPRTEVVWLWDWREALDVLALYGLMLFAQPWLPVIEDSPPFPMMHRCRGEEGRAKQSICKRKKKETIWVFLLLLRESFEGYSLCWLTSMTPWYFKSVQSITKIGIFYLSSFLGNALKLKTVRGCQSLPKHKTKPTNDKAWYVQFVDILFSNLRLCQF